MTGKAEQVAGVDFGAGQTVEFHNFPVTVAIPKLFLCNFPEGISLLHFVETGRIGGSLAASGTGAGTFSVHPVLVVIPDGHIFLSQGPGSCSLQIVFFNQRQLFFIRIVVFVPHHIISRSQGDAAAHREGIPLPDGEFCLDRLAGGVVGDGGGALVQNLLDGFDADSLALDPGVVYSPHPAIEGNPDDDFIGSGVPQGVLDGLFHKADAGHRPGVASLVVLVVGHNH